MYTDQRHKDIISRVLRQVDGKRTQQFRMGDKRGSSMMQKRTIRSVNKQTCGINAERKVLQATIDNQISCYNSIIQRVVYPKTKDWLDDQWNNLCIGIDNYNKGYYLSNTLDIMKYIKNREEVWYQTRGHPMIKELRVRRLAQLVRDGLPISANSIKQYNSLINDIISYLNSDIAPTKTEELSEYFNCFPHLAGEVNSNEKLVGGHLLISMQEKWGKNELLFSRQKDGPLEDIGSIKKDYMPWRAYWSNGEKWKNEESTFFPATWTLGRLNRELDYSTLIGSNRTLASQIVVRRTAATFYPVI